jgi:hypothetical protein
MEVHRHSSSQGRTKKIWTHYLWEFFMLFLAVFCGFLAEWKLERTLEHHREKQFIRSLSEDLARDTAHLRYYMRFNKVMRDYCDSVQYCIRNADIFKNSNNFYNYTKELARFTRYSPTDRTIQQLKHAGNMRLLRWDISNAVTDHDSKSKSLAEMDVQLNEQIIKYREFLISFLDLSSYDQHNVIGSYMAYEIKTVGNPGYISNDMKMVKMIYNQAFTLKIFLEATEFTANDLLNNTKQLLDRLRKDYHLT